MLKKLNKTKKHIVGKEPPRCGPKSAWFWLDRQVVKTYPGYYFPVNLLSTSVSPLTLHLRGPKQRRSLFRRRLVSIVYLHADWAPLCPGSGFQETPGGMRPARVTVSRIWPICSSSAASFLLRLRLKVHGVTDVTDQLATISQISYIWRAEASLEKTNTS